MFPMLGIIDNKDVDKKNIREVFVKMIDSYIKTHTIKKEPHEELMAMSCLDKDEKKMLLKLICKEQIHMIARDNLNYESMKYKKLEALKVKIKDM